MATAVVPARDLRAQLERFTPRMVEVVGARGADEYARRQIGLAMLAAQRNPDLAKCDPTSVAAAMIRVCGWKLEIGHTAHLVPFGRDCTAIPDWKGLVELMIRSGHVRDVFAEAVYAADVFRMVRGTEPRLEHEPALRDRGDLVGFYAVAVLRHGRTTFEWMTVADVEAIRTKARSGNSPAWKERYAEMGKKTVIRRLAKRMPQSDALRSALGMENDAGDVAGDVSVEGLAVPATLPGASAGAFPRLTAVASTGHDGYEQPPLVEEPTREPRSTGYRTPKPGRVMDALEQARTLENARRAAAQPDPYGHDDLSDEEALALDAQRAAADEMARERGA